MIYFEYLHFFFVCGQWHRKLLGKPCGGKGRAIKEKITFSDDKVSIVI